MTMQEKEKYKPVEELKKKLQEFSGEKFQLECGHHITWGSHLGNSITIYQVGRNEFTIICSQCGY